MEHFKQVCIAFDLIDGAAWTGGSVYLNNLLVSLRSTSDTDWLTTALIVPSNTPPDVYRNISENVARTIELPVELLRASIWKRVFRRVQSKIGIHTEFKSPIGTYLNHCDVDIVFSRNNFGPKFRPQLLSWIPDFQHIHMPEMFSKEEVDLLNEHFLSNAKYANRIILSSQNALQDFNRFAPEFSHKARVLPFVAHPPEKIYDANPEWICEHYNLPEKFFFLPNQFWKHKNHDVVIEALCSIRKLYPELTIVCTGLPYDYRNPEYFSTLLGKISTNGLRDNFIVLGLIPREHMFHLMRQCVALIQPSLFEGWSTTVEEAKSVGKRIIISDIPVHREQDPPKASFFDPSDAQALSKILAEVFEGGKAGPDDELESMARSLFPQRLCSFKQAFISIVKETVCP